MLPEIISKEPLGPSVRQGDDQWLTVVKWVHYALLNAEEAGVTQANVDEMVKSTNPEIKRLLGKDGELGKGHRPRQRLRRQRSSRQSATTASCSSATWARTRASRSPAG